MNKLFKKNKETDANFTVERRTPPVRPTDLNNGFVQVEVFIRGLEPGIDQFEPKGGRIFFDFYNKGYGFDLRTELTDKVNKVKTIFMYSVSRLPGRVVTAEPPKWEVLRGKIVIMLEKHPEDVNIHWEPARSSRGLDQSSRSSSDDD